MWLGRHFLWCRVLSFNKCTVDKTWFCYLKNLLQILLCSQTLTPALNPGNRGSAFLLLLFFLDLLFIAMVFLIYLFTFIYLAVPDVGYSSLTRDQTQAPCIGSVES